MRKTILAMDDDEKFLHALAMGLEEAGYDVLTAPDGLNGLRTALDQQPDLILADVMMPHCCGLLLRQKLHHLKQDHIPVVLMADHWLPRMKIEATQARAAAIWEKVLDFDSVRTLIESLLVQDPPDGGATATEVAEESAFPAQARPDNSVEGAWAEEAATEGPYGAPWSGSPNPRANPPTILIVEEDSHVSLALAICLRDAGFVVLTASDTTEGLKLAVAHRPELVLMNIWSPIGSEISFGRYVQELGLAPIPMIFMTSTKSNALRQQATAVGGLAYFEKPFDLDALVQTIDQVLVGDRCEALAA